MYILYTSIYKISIYTSIPATEAILQRDLLGTCTMLKLTIQVYKAMDDDDDKQ